MGTQQENFNQLTERIGRKTGGIGVSPFITDVRGRPADPAAYLFISGKAMGDKAGDMLELFRDVLLTARLDDQDRFRQVRCCCCASGAFQSAWCDGRPGSSIIIIINM